MHAKTEILKRKVVTLVLTKADEVAGLIQMAKQIAYGGKLRYKFNDREKRRMVEVAKLVEDQLVDLDLSLMDPSSVDREEIEDDDDF